MSDQHEQSTASRGAGSSEDDRIGGRRVALVGLVSGLVMFVAIGAAAWIARATTHALGREHVVTQTRRAPREIGIVDQTLIENEAYGQRLRESQRRSLDRYGWVDRPSGVARIPIERAIDLVVEQERAP
jgi:hypothetical protein